MERLGITQTIKGKPVVTTGPICALVAKGEVELCVTQISEILVAKGVTLVGPLPRDLQYVSTFVAALASRPSVAEAARGFLEFLVRPSFRAKFVEAGMDYQE
jgi:ABC-type molybdate transport system substrate-binding protein